MEWKLDITLGYMYGIDKNSPYADVNGKLYQHHYVMGEHIGRPLRSGECVHHIDRDRANNCLSNLRLMTITEHSLLHAIEDRGFKLENRNCPTCSKIFECSAKSDQIHCQASCAAANRAKFSVSREDLYNLVWKMPTTQVAKTLGVSDVAVAKRCKKLNVPKPNRGYWAKVQSGLSPEIPPLD